MKREIKFRAWNGESMIVWDVTGDFNDHDYYLVLGCMSPLMEYIGLKDRDGLEIYEGDIIRNPHDHYPFYVVKKCVTGFCLCLPEDIKQKCDPESMEKYCMGEFWSVVGNIYENPELLENNQ